MNDDIVILTRFNLDNSRLEYIQFLEKTLDDALEAIGYTRVGSSKGGMLTEFKYKQYGKAI
jgi:hypothetical protein